MNDLVLKAKQTQNSSRITLSTPSVKGFKNRLASSSAMLQEQLHLQGQISFLCHLNPYPSSAHIQR